MKNNFLIFLIFLSHNIYSQEDAWVYFTDKPNAQFYLDNPLEMLSQRAIDRRVAQNISIDITDVPIHQPYLDELANQSGIEIKAKSKWFNCAHVRGSVESINSLLSGRILLYQSIYYDFGIHLIGNSAVKFTMLDTGYLQALIAKGILFSIFLGISFYYIFKALFKNILF